MVLRQLVVLLLFLGASLCARAQTADAVFARFKTVSGGAAWESVRSWQGDGTLSTGGLSGEFQVRIDLRDGRSSDSYKLGSIQGAEGYDGTRGWSRDPGGEVSALDAPEAIRRARSQAWIDAHGYWYPKQHPASVAAPQAREQDGRHFLLIEATPSDADAVTLWFDADSGLLARTAQRQGQDTITTTFDDYRDVQDVRLPFRSASDVTDAAGRTDPRQHSEIALEKIALNVTFADTDFAMPAMAQTARIDAASGIATIPFELINNHIYVDASIDGKPAHLLVDTGGANVLTPVAAKRLGLTAEGRMSAAGTGEQRVDLAVAHAREVRVGGAVLATPVFYVLDMGALDAVEGVTADGLIGYEMFRRFGVKIDYANKRMTLTRADKFAAPANVAPISFELDDHIPIIAGMLDGMPVRLSVDTGSRSSLSLHSPFVRKHDLVARYHAAADSVIGWGVGGATRGAPVRLGSLMLGDQRIVNIAADLFTGDKGSFANPDVSGNLGGGVLRRFTVTFDYANKRLYLEPNANFAMADEFDRSGVWVLAENGALRITDVARDSAAQTAALQADDRITMIDGVTIAKRSLMDWRQRLRTLPVGTSLKITYLRSGKTRTTTLILANRIPPIAVPEK